MTREELINLLADNGIENPSRALVSGILNAQTEAIKGAKAEAIAQTKEEFKDFVKKEDYDNLNTSLTKAKKEFEDYKNGIVARERSQALEQAIKGAKGKNPKAILALLDSEKITYKDGKIEGLDDQLKNLQKSDSYLFEGVVDDNYSGGKPSDEINKIDMSSLTKL